MTTPEPRDVPLALINEPEAVIRSSMNPEKLADLAESIRATGQLQRIILYPEGERFTIAAGHRRFVALGILGDRDARCDVYADKFDAMLAVQIAENVFREDMTPTDEAVFFARLLEYYTEDTTRLAERLKLNRGYIEGRLALLAGDRQIFDAVAAGKISLGVAHSLNDFPNEQLRRAYLDMAIHREATVATVDKWCAEAVAIEVLKQRVAEQPADAPAVAVEDVVPPVMCCDVCGDADEPWTMVMVWMHTRCKKLRERMLAAAMADREASRG